MRNLGLGFLDRESERKRQKESGGGREAGLESHDAHLANSVNLNRPA